MGERLSERKREQRGEENIIEALAVQMPDVFYSEILPKLDLISTLNLAQVSKRYNDAVWSVDGVRSMEAKMEAKIKAASTGYSSEPLYWAASLRQHARGQGPPEVWGGRERELQRSRLHASALRR